MRRKSPWLLALALALALVGVLAYRAGGARPQPVGPPVVSLPGLDEAAAAERLAEAIRIPTVSLEGSGPPAAELARLRSLLETRYPRLHAALRREIVAEGSLLFEWPGADESLPPVVLQAHQDVVPVADEDRGGWTQPPFDGVVAAGFVWGRGALDDKGSLVAILEAVESLVAEDRAPRRTVLLAFGHDEEVLGAGAKALARRVRADWPVPRLVLDEGMAVTEGIVPGVARPVALIGLAEKGYATIDLAVEMAGGHSSMPPSESAIGVLARALGRIEERPMPSRFEGLAREMFSRVGPEMGWSGRLLAGNLWLFAPIVSRVMGGSPSGAAAQRTTIAPTLLAAGVKENVLARQARATVNSRLLPGDSVDDLMAHLRRVIDDERVRITPRPGGQPASPVSRMDGDGYAAIDGAIRDVFPAAAVAPALVLGATDARHFAEYSDRVYRFVPMRLAPVDLARPHGVDERISITNHAEQIRFYRRLLERAAF